MKLFVFFAAAVLVQQNVCSADCEQTHVDALIQFNHDQACINAANDDFLSWLKQDFEECLGVMTKTRWNWIDL